jgi:hypothetical protein
VVFDYKNKKSGEDYKVINLAVINATNAQDGQQMVLYMNKAGVCFVRERSEFFKKFLKNGE